MRDRQDRSLARKKFRQAMKEEIMNKAPGMKFVLDISDEGARLTPRVIHALGNIKWGFTDGLKPIPIEQIQSKWDREKLLNKGRTGSTEQMEEFKLTSRAVNWGHVKYVCYYGKLLFTDTKSYHRS